MAESNPKSGTVTSLESLFPPEEAKKASKRVQEAIADRRKELDLAQSFSADNSALIKLVRQLPDQVSHEIMVPFGSAAFFPGRLIHTNEFLVLLGDGYYAERSSKQTVDILKRREKALEAQVEALKASMADLETEAKFFDSTAAEAKEGLVEIREEYVEPPQNSESVSGVRDSRVASSSKADNTNMLDKDEKYAQMMARLDELEKEELEAGTNEDEDNEHVHREDEDAEDDWTGSDEVEDEEFEHDEDAHALASSKNYIINKKTKIIEKHKPKDTELKLKDQDSFYSTASRLAIGGSHQHLPEPSSILDLSSQLKARDGSSMSNMERFHTTGNRNPLPPEPKDDPDSFAGLKLESTNKRAIQSSLRERKAFTGTIIERLDSQPSNQPMKSTASDQSANIRTIQSGLRESKAFTGTIIERLDGQPSNQPMKSTASDQSTNRRAIKSGLHESKAFSATSTIIERMDGQPSNQPMKSTASDQPSRPISKFMMQRGYR